MQVPESKYGKAEIFLNNRRIYHK